MEIIDSFGGVLREHLHAEIDTLLSLERFGDEKSCSPIKEGLDRAQTLLSVQARQDVPILVFPDGKQDRRHLHT